MDRTTPEPAGTAQVSIGGFKVRANQRPSRLPAPAQPAPASPRHHQPPQPKPAAPARPALRLVSSTAEPRPTRPQPRPAEGAWRYWISVTFTDGHTGATLELRRTAPIATSDDRSAVADGIAVHMKRPIASIAFITPIAKPNDVTGEPEPDVPPNLRTSPADDPQPWRYRVSYATAGGRGECTLGLAEPIRSGDDLNAIQESISAQYGRTVVAIESFSVLAAPAKTAPGGAGA